MNANTNSYKNLFVTKIGNIFEKMFKRSLYRILLTILGFPVLIVVGIKYLMDKKDYSYAEFEKNIENQFYQDGKKKVLKEEIQNQLNNKLKFFNKTLSDDEFNKEVDKIFQRRIKELLSFEIDKAFKNKEIKKVTFTQSFKGMLEKKAFYYFVVIIGFPMLLLMGIYNNPYFKYIFERLVMMIFVIFGVTFLVFTIMYLSPLDPAVNILGQGATAEQIADFNRIYGLDKPYFVQLLETFKNLFTFDLGKSFSGNEEVIASIARKFPVTLNLTFISLVVGIVLAIPAGIISATRPYSAYDFIFMLVALIGLSLPNFWFGLVLILNFSIEMKLLPATFTVGNWLSFIMPAIVLGTDLAATIARMTRSSMLEVVKQDYILTARAKGLSEKKVIIKHALGNAMIPIVTVIGLQFGGMLGGSAVTEKVFNVNGIGSFIVDKQFVPDIPIVLAGVVYVAVIISVANLVVDIMYSFLDPRIKSKMKNY
ncbi:ABC transporter permease [Clostridium sp.]|uniref:ABC transporter permease n=1 Tax=Clostridium sp. TaxID=1506 RepID=UPI002FCABB62